MQKRIGNTPFIQLHTTQKSYGVNAEIFAKLENENPGGSIKDRVALAIIDDAEKRGILQNGGTVYEATSGNTGVGLALVAAARGYKAVILMPENMSKERQIMMKERGAKVVLTPAKEGMQGAVERAKALAENTQNAFLASQFTNPANVQAHYLGTAPEIWEQSKADVDIFVTGVGTGGTITGIARYLKEKNPDVKIVGVEPARSPLLSKGIAGAHGIQGIGANFIPEILDRSLLDEILTVTDEEAIAFAKFLQKDEGVFVGISSGANVAAAVRLAKRQENAGKRIVTIFPDSGDRYLSIL